jgi:hypothetical protein
MWNNPLRIPALGVIAKNSESESLKAAVSKMTPNERAKLTDAIRALCQDQLSEYHDRVLDAEARARKFEAMVDGYFFYEAFYKTLAGKPFVPIESGSITINVEMLDGIKEAVDYLKTTPTQIVQHYGDPNPKEKVSRYYHHKDKE